MRDDGKLSESHYPKIANMKIQIRHQIPVSHGASSHKKWKKSPEVDTILLTERQACCRTYTVTKDWQRHHMDDCWELITGDLLLAGFENADLWVWHTTAEARPI